MRITAVTLRSASVALAGVRVAVAIDTSGIITTITVEVEERLELELKVRATLGESTNDIAFETVCGRRSGYRSDGAEERGCAVDKAWHVEEV